MAKHAPTRHYSPDQLQERATKAAARHLSQKGYRAVRVDPFSRDGMEVVAVKQGTLVGMAVRTAGKLSLDDTTTRKSIKTLRSLADTNALAADKVSAGSIVMVKNPQSLNPVIEVVGSPVVEDARVAASVKVAEGTSMSNENLKSYEDIDAELAGGTCPRCWMTYTPSGACNCVE